MRLVHDGFPVPAPFQTKVHAEHTHGHAFRGIPQVAIALEDTDIEGKPEIVIGVPGPGVGDPVARQGAALCVEGILLLVGPVAADDLDTDPGLACLVHQGLALPSTCTPSTACTSVIISCSVIFTPSIHHLFIAQRERSSNDPCMDEWGGRIDDGVLVRLARDVADDVSMMRY